LQIVAGKLIYYDFSGLVGVKIVNLVFAGSFSGRQHQRHRSIHLGL